MAIPTFPLPYDFREDIEETSAYATRSVTFESQKRQVQRMAIDPLRTWKITCKGNASQRLILKSFHDSVGGNSSVFYFVDPDGVTRTCRFADPKLTMTDIREYTSGSTGGTIVGFISEIVIETAL